MKGPGLRRWQIAGCSWESSIAFLKLLVELLVSPK
jgi:hypothetical protein